MSDLIMGREPEYGPLEMGPYEPSVWITMFPELHGYIVRKRDASKIQMPVHLHATVIEAIETIGMWCETYAAMGRGIQLHIYGVPESEEIRSMLSERGRLWLDRGRHDS